MGAACCAGEGGVQVAGVGADPGGLHRSHLPPGHRERHVAGRQPQQLRGQPADHAGGQPDPERQPPARPGAARACSGTPAGLSPAAHRRLSLRGRGLFSLRGLRAHQRSHSSGGSTSPGCTYHDSMDPSDEEGRGGAGGGGAGSEHSETLSSLSLTSLFCPPPPPPLPGLTPARKFSSTSSLAAPGRPRAAAPAHGLARSPSWAADRSKDPLGGAPLPMGLGPLAPPPQPLPGELEPGDAASKRKR